MKIRIAILDDHQIVLDGLKLLLGNHPNFTIDLEFTRGSELLRTMLSNEIDILLTDIMMPEMDGFEVAMKMKSDFPNVKVIVLSMNGEGVLIDKLMEEAKVAGYVLKTADKNELIHAIETVFDGDVYYSKAILEELQAYKRIKKENDAMHLTVREIEIIQCIAQDMSNKQIADNLFISERTVETHRKNIFRKTNVHSAIGLIEFAKKRKIIL
jgi:two-component system nitrate/nitrite response regulator NarL